MNDRYSYALSAYGVLCKRGRTCLNMTRPELARKLKMTVGEIEKIERGLMAPSEQYIATVTGILGLSMNEVKAALADQTSPTISDNVVIFPGASRA